MRLKDKWENKIHTHTILLKYIDLGTPGCVLLATPQRGVGRRVTQYASSFQRCHNPPSALSLSRTCISSLPSSFRPFPFGPVPKYESRGESHTSCAGCVETSSARRSSCCVNFMYNTSSIFSVSISLQSSRWYSLFLAASLDASIGSGMLRMCSAIFEPIPQGPNPIFSPNAPPSTPGRGDRNLNA